MKRNFDVVLCVRGRGTFKAGDAYAMIKTAELESYIFSKAKHGGVTSSMSHLVMLKGSCGGMCWKNIAPGDGDGACFVEVKRCKRKEKKNG